MSINAIDRAEVSHGFNEFKVKPSNYAIDIELKKADLELERLSKQTDDDYWNELLNS